MKEWHEFYENRVNSSYQRYFEKRYKVFLDYIHQHSKGIIVDAGCGIGSVSKYFHKKVDYCLGFDNSLKMIRLARVNVPEVTFYYDNIKIYNKDLPEHTLVSHGVLEHFNDEDIETVLKSHPGSVHYVPLDKYISPSFGDERLLPAEYWKTKFNITDVTIFNNGYDLFFKSNY